VTSIQPELWVDRGMAALAFYESAFGARVLHRVGDGDDIVAQLAIGDAAFWIATTRSSTERLVPRAIGGATGRVLLVVDDPDAVFAHAVAAGCSRQIARRRGPRLAGREAHRSVRPRVGNRHTAYRLATEGTIAVADPPRSDGSGHTADHRSGAHVLFAVRHTGGHRTGMALGVQPPDVVAGNNRNGLLRSWDLPPGMVGVIPSKEAIDLSG
jgi:PhnB protein